MASPPSSNALNADDLHRNLMVNNIPQNWTAAELQNLFAPYGNIEACNIVTNKQTHVSKGYGFVKFFSRAEAETALQSLNGCELEGRPIVVKKADLGKGPQGPATIYVSGFSPDLVTEQMLQETFGQFGTVQRLKLHPSQPGKKGVAFITYECFAEAELACNAMNGQMMPTGDPVQVKFDNRTAQAAQAAQGKVIAGPAVLQNPGLQNLSPFMLMGPDQRAMRTRAPMVAPAARFAPYQAPIVPKPRAMPAMSTMPSMPAMSASVITPLPNGADGNYCIFVYGVQSPEMIQQLIMPFGTVAAVRMQPGKKFGFVSMPMYHEAVNVINNLNGRTLPGGITLQVRLASDAKKDGSPEETM